MGGKRPDQYRIAPGEATRTDYKWTADADQIDLKNQAAARNRARTRGRQMIPPAVPNPEVERLRAREMERQRHLEEQEQEQQHEQQHEQRARRGRRARRER